MGTATPAAQTASDIQAPTPSQRKPQAAVPAVPSKNRRVRILVAVLSLVVVGGGALKFTQFGPFGYYFIYDTVKGKTYQTLFATTQSSVHAMMAKDTMISAKDAIDLSEAAHKQEPRAHEVTAYNAYLIYQTELRFGNDVARDAHAKTLMGLLPPDATGVWFDLARAAQSASSGTSLARARINVDRLARTMPSNVDVIALAGEVSMAAKDGSKATEHFGQLLTLERSPRAYFGLARAQLLAKKVDAAEKNANKVLEIAPKHAGSRLLLAEIFWSQSKKNEAKVQKLLEEISKDPLVMAAASRDELARVHTLLGKILLGKFHYTAAEKSFEAALKLQPQQEEALNGMGEALFRSGRYSDALARFSSAIQANPEAIAPKIGAAKTKIALERFKDAKDMLKKLAATLEKANKQDFRVIAWIGKAEEALGDKSAAEQNYLKAIKLAEKDEAIVDTYVALAKLLISQGRSEESKKKLEEAKLALPNSMALHQALGQIAFSAGRYEEAKTEFKTVLAADDSQLEVLFQYGIVLRRLREFKEAHAVFEKVEKADKNYPGLSLERAVLYEDSGETAKALELFRSALAKSPKDPDLMLRVAAALLGTNQAEQAVEAEKLLKKVIVANPNGAEANHFLGRALLIQGTNLAQALHYLKRATDIDNNRAEYHLYVGWAANEADDQSQAQKSLERALELDKSMADAYWQRGVLKHRQRLILDAEKDLKKALELRPSRFEAYATLAEVYEEQQKWTEAQNAWQKAIQANGKEPTWRYRLGKLYATNRNQLSALEHLSIAVKYGAEKKPTPPWLSDAFFLVAEAERSTGKKTEAIEHYQRFLSVAPADSPFRKDAIAALAGLGAPYNPRQP
jgi:cellulose synthase operon protein C